MIFDYFGFAVGEMGISPDYFWHEMDDDELKSLFKAHNKKSTDEWERARFVAYYSVQWGKNPPSMKKFLPLDSDDSDNKKVKQKKKTIEERRQVANGFMKTFNLNNGK